MFWEDKVSKTSIQIYETLSIGTQENSTIYSNCYRSSYQFRLQYKSKYRVRQNGMSSLKGRVHLGSGGSRCLNAVSVTSFKYLLWFGQENVEDFL